MDSPTGFMGLPSQLVSTVIAKLRPDIKNPEHKRSELNYFSSELKEMQESKK